MLGEMIKISYWQENWQIFGSYKQINLQYKAWYWKNVAALTGAALSGK